MPRVSVSVMRLQGFAAVVCILAASRCAAVETVTLKLVPSGAIEKVGTLYGQRLALSNAVPDGVKQIPSSLKAPLYGVLKLGPRENPTGFAVLIDDISGPSPRLYVDSDADGALTDDPPVKWARSEYRGQDGQTHWLWSGDAEFDVPYGGHKTSLFLNMRLYDPTDPVHAVAKNSLTYYPDYACMGDLKSGSHSYPVAVVDAMITGDFRGNPDNPYTTVLLVDANASGQYRFLGPATAPFNLSGTTTEMRALAADGGSFEVVPSAHSVPLFVPPPDLSVGKPAPPFTHTTLDGHTVRFPTDYKGKIVLLYFWATWCGGCILQIPYLRHAYDTFHTQGLEVLEVSLDKENGAAQLAAYTRANHMVWPQIYDGKFLDAEVAQLYFVHATPFGFLVDGDTGKILARGDSLRGDKLAETISAALAAKSHSTSSG